MNITPVGHPFVMGQATRAFECLCFLLDILHVRSRHANNSRYSIGPFITSEVMGALSLTAQLSSPVASTVIPLNDA